jgi:hypothetical protein
VKTLRRVQSDENLVNFDRVRRFLRLHISAQIAEYCSRELQRWFSHCLGRGCVKTSALFRHGEKLIICAPAPSILGLTTSVSIPDFKLMPYDYSFYTASARSGRRVGSAKVCATDSFRGTTALDSSIIVVSEPVAWAIVSLSRLRRQRLSTQRHRFGQLLSPPGPSSSKLYITTWLRPAAFARYRATSAERANSSAVSPCCG